MECADVSPNQPGLMECSDHVLPGSVIHTCLAAHRAIDLREQCCGDMDEMYAAHIERAGEAGDIADHPTAKCNNAGIPVKPVFKEIGKYVVGPEIVFILLPVRNKRAETVEPGIVQGAHDLFAVESENSRVADNSNGGAEPEPGRSFTDTGKRAAADHNIIASFSKSYRDLFHSPSLK